MEDKTYSELTDSAWRIYARKMKRIEETYETAKTKAWDAFQQEVDKEFERYNLEKSTVVRM
jgi:hypothetical protein